MKLKLSLILIVACVVTVQAQKAADKTKAADDKTLIAAQQRILKKQIVADELDRQAKDIAFADVRIFIRTRLAQWLWKDGKDETGRAEPLAVKAFEELDEKKDEIVEARSLKANLLTLLEANAKETARRLKIKYNIGAAEDLANATSQLNQKGGDKIVADKIKKDIPVETDLARIQMFLTPLRRQKSPEFLPILFEIIKMQESGINEFSSASLFWIADNFNDSTVPNDLRVRFYKIVLNKAGKVLQSGDSNEIHFTDLLLFRVLPDMTANAPALAAEAIAVKSALSAKVPQGTKDLEELEQRINESTDKIETLTFEADKTDNKNLKSSLLSRASRLALDQQKFKLAADLIEKTVEEQFDNNSIAENLLVSAHDQQLMQITDAALQKDDIFSAEYATKKITADLQRAGALLSAASYFVRKKDFVSALAAYDEALELTVKAADDDKSKLSVLFRLINAANYLDRNRLSNIISITADAVNKIPTLNVEDKSGTAKFKDYVSMTMRINLFLFIAVSNLTRTNRLEAVNFTNAINRREFRIAADLALETGMFEPEKKQDLK